MIGKKGQIEHNTARFDLQCRWMHQQNVQELRESSFLSIPGMLFLGCCFCEIEDGWVISAVIRFLVAKAVKESLPAGKDVVDYERIARNPCRDKKTLYTQQPNKNMHRLVVECPER